MPTSRPLVVHVLPATLATGLAVGALVAGPIVAPAFGPPDAGGLAAQIPAYEGPPPTAVVRYGGHPLQFGNLFLPEGEGPFPVAVAVHGGCWLDRLGEGSLTPAGAALTESGIATWDVEYRRLGHEGGGWPGTFVDVGAAVDHLRVLAEDHPLDLERVVIFGHSSGGPLAAWAAARSALPADSEIRGEDPLPVRAAVAIDGPMDLAGWQARGVDAQICGEPVVSMLLGGTPAEVPERYAQTAPVEMPAPASSLHLVPAQMVLNTGGHDRMLERAVETGQNVHLHPVPESDHFQLITPEHETWAPVRDVIRRALGMAAEAARPGPGGPADRGLIGELVAAGR